MAYELYYWDGLQGRLASERRLAFNETGVFRHDPELDQDPA